MAQSKRGISCIDVEAAVAALRGLCLWNQNRNGIPAPIPGVARLAERIAASCLSGIRNRPRVCALTAAIATSMTFGCATPHAILNFTAPSTTVVGTPFTVTVTVTVEGNRDTIINSYISFTSSDPAAVLPARYGFTTADAGSHTWTNGFTLMTPGNQTISATIYQAPGINGSATVAVSP